MTEFARVSVAGMPGYCEKPKCLRKAGHDGECWPKPSTNNESEDKA